MLKTKSMYVIWIVLAAILLITTSLCKTDYELSTEKDAMKQEQVTVLTMGLPKAEEVLREAKETALREMQDQAARMGANAVIGVDLDYETVGGSGSMLMVTASGTAVYIE